MKKFLVIYQSPAESLEQMLKATPEQKAASMKPWMDWYGKIGEAVVDAGAPVMRGLAIGKDGSAKPGASDLSGYTIIQAESIEKAQSLLVGHPHNDEANGLKVELHECIAM